MTRKPPTTSKPQGEKFKDAARELGADENEKRWEERLRKVAKPRGKDPSAE